ncbi:MAG: P-II family nitrogen regulator [Bauldia sp.]|nr:P-II family nitrogen regulator [Bauldia sp.]
MTGTSLIVSIVPKGRGDTVLEASVHAGAHGGTVLFGRGAGVNEQQKLFGIPIMPEKEIVLTIVYENQSDTVLAAIVKAARLEEPGAGMAFEVAVEKVVGVAHLFGPAA